MRAGEVIDGRFQVERFVARGGMGEVHRALDRTQGQPVALKIIDADDPALLTRVAREAHALADLDHPAVVRYIAHGRLSDARAYLAMEWLEGVTLAGWLKHRAVSIDEALRCALRIAEGLGAAHRKGMVHRDVKPGNVFLVSRRFDRAKVLDFGLVHSAWQQLTTSSAGMGTPEYMSPEQVRCEADIGPASDVFSLGAVLFRCIAGRPPFEAPALRELLAKIALFESPPTLGDQRADVPPSVGELVSTLMAAHRDKRPANGDEAADAIRRARDEQSAVASTDRERDVLTLTTAEHVPAVILAIESDVPLEPTSDPWLASLRELAAPIGARVVPLANGSVMITITGTAQAHDLAITAARLALTISRTRPTSSIALASQSVVFGEDAHGGEAALPGGRAGAIAIDRKSRDLLAEGFVLAGDDESGWTLVDERDADTAPRRLLGRPMPFVGRQAVLRQLLATLDGVIEDRSARAVLVVGEPGVGKSRLRFELMAALRERGIARVRASGEALRTSVPAGVIARAVRDAVGTTDPRTRIGRYVAAPDRDRVIEFVACLANLPLASEPSPALQAARRDPRFMAEQEQRAVEDWLIAECRAHPTVLIVDDLQWADRRSLELIQAALRRTRDLPFLVLALARPEAQERFPKLQETWRADVLRLEPLRAAACEQLVREALGDDATPGLIARLVEHSGGNPFYLEELIRSAASHEPASLPGSVLASLQLRIGAKPARARLVLRAASVYGRVFWGGAVHALVGGEMERAELDEWLAVLERDELIERRGGARAFAGEVEYAFRHDLLRDASYQMLTPEDRRAGHRLAGAWLVAHDEADAVVLAEHFAGGGATAQAVSWFERAAEDALAAGAADVAALRKAAAYYRRAAETCAAAYANESAIAHFERAAALFGSIAPLEAARTRLALAKVREVSGEQDAALEDLRAAEDEAGGDAELRVEILIARAYVQSRLGREGALEQGIETAEAALELARAEGLRDLEVLAMTSLAGALLRSEAPAAIARAVELAQRAVATTEDRSRLAHALWRLGNVFLAGNQLEASARLYADALAAAEGQRDELLVANCRANMGMLAFRRWQLDLAIEHAQEALERYERIGYQTRIREMTLNLGMFLHLRGDTRRGRELLGNVLAQSQGDWVLSTLAQETLADAERRDGREARAQARLRSAARTCERVGVPNKQALYLGMLAESLWASGHPVATVSVLAAGSAIAPELSLSHGLLRIRIGDIADGMRILEGHAGSESDPQRRAMAKLGVARGHAWLGDPARARLACDEAMSVLAPTPVARFMAPLQALRAALDGDLPSAIAALAMTEECSAPFEHAEAALDVGVSLDGATTERPTIERYLALTRDVVHRGVRPHVEAIRARLFARLGDQASAHDSRTRADAELSGLIHDLAPDVRATFLAHPIVNRLHPEHSASADRSSPVRAPSLPATEPETPRWGVSPPSSAGTATLARWLVASLLAQPSRSHPELVIERGPNPGDRVQLPAPPVTISIGPGVDADWRLTTVPTRIVIERSHEGVRLLRDGHTSVLRHDDTIELGTTVLRFLDPAAELERQLDQKLDRTAPASIGAHPRRVPVQAIIAVAIAATALALAFWILL